MKLPMVLTVPVSANRNQVKRIHTTSIVAFVVEWNL